MRELPDASFRVRSAALAGSSAEIEHVRRPGALAGDAVQAIGLVARPGVFGEVICGDSQNGSQESNLRRTFSVMRDTLLS